MCRFRLRKVIHYACGKQCGSNLTLVCSASSWDEAPAPPEAADGKPLPPNRADVGSVL